MQNPLFTSAVTGEKKLRPDVIAIVQNEITVVDDHTPSPGEIQSEETIILPEIISMTEYIRRHCEREIVAACINQISPIRWLSTQAATFALPSTSTPSMPTAIAALRRDSPIFSSGRMASP